MRKSRFVFVWLMIGSCLLHLHGYVNAQSLPYQNPALPVQQRVNDLLQRMTLTEKLGQLNGLLGWDMYTKTGDSVTISDLFKKVMNDRQIGMLWATLRADPWTKKTLITGLNPALAAKAVNALQAYTIHHTRLGIPLLLAEECAHGHMAIGTTVFPTSIGQASTWDTALVQQMASVIAAETRAQGAQIGYGPVLDLAREPRWSRMEETYGEDPVLIAAMGKAVVQGFQGSTLNSDSTVAATLKHFAAYGSPEGGHNGGIANVGLRELNEAYLPPFFTAVQAGAASVMASYNSTDGIPSSSNRFLLTDLLRTQWGFTGFTVSDLGSIPGLQSTHHVAENRETAAALAINAGLDADLGGEAYGEALRKAVDNGTVRMAVLDTAVARVLRLKFRLGLFEHPYAQPAMAAATAGNTAHAALARQVAAESLVLLKNEQHTLPLKKTMRIAVIGPNADNVYNQLGDYTAPQPDDKVITVLKGIQALVPASQVQYVKGCAIRDTTFNEIEQAVAAAQQADAVVLVLGGSSARDFKTSYENTGAAKVNAGAATLSDMESGEGYDRVSLDLMGLQNQLLQRIAATGKPVVLVLIEGRPLNINFAAEHIPAIINAWYPGQQGGAAIAAALFGDASPAGRLPVSIPRSTGQLPVYYNYKPGSRHDYVEMTDRPLYAFGHGLSYTSFAYSGLQLQVQQGGGKIQVSATCKIQNTGAVAGDEVVQLYLRDDISSVVTPAQQLKQFARIHLQPGEEKEVHFVLHATDLQLFNAAGQWVTEPGSFTVMMGAASDDIRLKDSFRVNR